MVLGSFCPGEKTAKRSKGKAKRFHCFHCGTWRKTMRKRCYANTVRWELLDDATEKLLQTVSDRIDTIQKGKASTLLREEWLRKSELGINLLYVAWAAEGECGLQGPTPGEFDKKGEQDADRPVVVNGDHEDDDEFKGRDIFDCFRQLRERGIDTNKEPERVVMGMIGHILSGDVDFLERADAPSLFESAFQAYSKRFEEETAELREELEEVTQELEDAALELPRQRRNPTVYDRLSKRVAELEKRKAEIEPRLVPLTQKAEAIMQQLAAIKNTIAEADKTKLARLLDSFLERVEPVFEVKQVGKTRKRRTQVTGVRFVPRDTAKNVLPEVMEIGVSRTGRGSWRPPARSGRGRWWSLGPGRWSPGRSPAAGAAPPGFCGGTRAARRGRGPSAGRFLRWRKSGKQPCGFGGKVRAWRKP
jgi:hypothetical protein